jgi:hypothetical protein
MIANLLDIPPKHIQESHPEVVAFAGLDLETIVYKLCTVFTVAQIDDYYEATYPDGYVEPVKPVAVATPPNEEPEEGREAGVAPPAPMSAPTSEEREVSGAEISPRSDQETPVRSSRRNSAMEDAYAELSAAVNGHAATVEHTEATVEANKAKLEQNQATIESQRLRLASPEATPTMAAIEGPGELTGSAFGLELGRTAGPSQEEGSMPAGHIKEEDGTRGASESNRIESNRKGDQSGSQMPRDDDDGRTEDDDAVTAAMSNHRAVTMAMHEHRAVTMAMHEHRQEASEQYCERHLDGAHREETEIAEWDKPQQGHASFPSELDPPTVLASWK